MRGFGLERPPTWGLLTLILLVVGNVALFSFISMKPVPADSYVPRTTPVAATTEPATPVTPVESLAQDAVSPLLAVYGDGYASGNEMGGGGAAGWPALVAQQTGTELVLNAVPQAGYASVGATGQDYPALIAASPVPGAAVTVLFGSRNDADEDLSVVEANAAQVIAAVRQGAPGSVIVVVGPVWDDADVPASAFAVRDVVQTAAQAAGVTFVDPLAEGWFAQEAGLISADGISPNDAGHAYLARRIAPIVSAALPDAAG
jgi:lysophospholipase L1-like esterase